MNPHRCVCAAIAYKFSSSWRVFRYQQLAHKDLIHSVVCFLCEGEIKRCVVLTLWWRQTASDEVLFFFIYFFYLRTSCVTTPIISIQRLSVVPVCFIRIWFHPPHQRCRVEEMISMIKSLSGAYIAMSARHLNTKAPHPACCRSPASQHPTIPPPPCLRSPGKLCISALGGKHYTGLAQGSVSLNILSWPLAVILLMARVSSSTFIRTSAEGEAGEGERERAASSSRKEKKPKRRQENQNVSRPADVF